MNRIASRQPGGPECLATLRVPLLGPVSWWTAPRSRSGSNQGYFADTRFQPRHRPCLLGQAAGRDISPGGTRRSAPLDGLRLLGQTAGVKDWTAGGDPALPAEIRRPRRAGIQEQNTTAATNGPALGSEPGRGTGAADAPEQNRRSPRVALAALALLGVGGLVVTTLGGLDHLAALRDRRGAIAGLALVPLQTLMSVSFSPIPSDAVALVIASLCGFWAGSVLIWIGWMAGAVVQYELARHAGADGSAERLRARLPRRLRTLDPSHPLFLICTRWLPLGPHIVGTLAGALGVPRVRYLGSAALATLPVSLLVAAMGAGIGTWLTNP